MGEVTSRAKKPSTPIILHEAEAQGQLHYAKARPSGEERPTFKPWTTKLCRLAVDDLGFLALGLDALGVR